LRSLRGALKPGGTLIVLVPQKPSLYGALDRKMGHKRRFTRSDLRAVFAAEGFSVEKTHDFNKAGAPPWWFYSRVLGRSRISKLTLKIFDKTVWLWRRVDGLLPWTGLSAIVVAKKPGSYGTAPEYQNRGTALETYSKQG
jgi:hypothetical protein